MAGTLGDGNAPASVILDTGSTSPYPIILSEAAAARIALPLGPSQAPASATAIGAAPGRVRLGWLPAFSVGGVAGDGGQVLVLPDIDRLATRVGRTVDAIVGARFVSTRTISIDHGRSRVDLAAPAGTAAAALPFTLAPRRPLALVTATVNGVGPFTLAYDSGANSTSLSPAAAARAGVKPTGRTVITGIAGTTEARDGAATVAVGGASSRLPRVPISGTVDDLSRTAGVAVDGILGVDFFRGRRITLDYPGRRLWIEASAPVSRPAPPRRAPAPPSRR